MAANPDYLTMTTLIGQIIEVRGDRMIAAFSRAAGDGQTASIGRLGSFVSVQQNGLRVLASVLSMADDTDRDRRQNPEAVTTRVTLMPVGQLDADGGFSPGINSYPTTGAKVYAVEDAELRALFDIYAPLGFEVGTLPARHDQPVYLHPGRLYGRHLAILGQSGSGKSWTVTSLLQRTVERMPNAHIVLLDLHGEYVWRDEQGQVRSAFEEGSYRYLSARDLEIPYWLLTYSELVDLLIDRNDPGASTQIAFLRETVFSLRKKANEHLDLDRLSVDSPVYFPLAQLFLAFKKANEQTLDFGKARGALNGQFDEFLVKLQSKLNDARYDFLFKPTRRTDSSTLADLLRDFIGLGEERSQITVIDLSPVPFDVRPTVSAQIGRLAFEFNYWNPHYREFPISLVCEEAHAYIPRDRHGQYEGTRRAMERIAKEGRKYGVSLVVVSQRPHELSETVLAQCGNYICLRVTNPDDQDYIRQLVPESTRDLTETLSSLGRGEALILGEATPLPTRVQFTPPDPPPNSNDVDFHTYWRDGMRDLDIDTIVSRWRNQRR